jgi:hypothetical protein
VSPNAKKKVYKAASFVKLEDGRTRLDPRQLAGRDGRNFAGFCALVFLLAMLPRARLWAFAACMAMTCAWLVVPVLCSTLMLVIGAPWAVARLGNVLVIGLCTVVPAALFAITNRLRRHALPRAMIGLAAVACALAYGQAAGINYGPWSAKEYLLAVEKHRAAQTAQTIRERSEFFAANIAPGSTVMANNRWDYNLPMHFRCYTLALNPGRGWHGVPFQQERRALVDEFFTGRTSGERRLEILRKYGVHYVFTSRNFTPLLLRSMGGHAGVRAMSKHGVIVYVTL